LLVLDRAVLEAARTDGGEQRTTFRRRERDRLLAVDVLARRDRLLQNLAALMRRGGVEEDGELRVGQCRVEIGAPLGEAVRRGDLRKLLRVATDQQGTRDDAVVADREAGSSRSARSRR
jgi:hypothetical protein